MQELHAARAQRLRLWPHCFRACLITCWQRLHVCRVCSLVAVMSPGADLVARSGAIAQHRSGESSQQSTTAAASRRGRGRGSYTAVARHRNAKWVAPGRPGASSQDNSRSNSPAVAETARNSTTIPAPGPYGYRNKTLVLGGGSGSSTPVATPKPSSNTPTAPSTPQAGPTASSSAVAPASKEVVIDGVAFVADSRGNKLVRKLGASVCLAQMIPRG